MIRDGLEPLSFEDALSAEEKRLKTQMDDLSTRGSMSYGYYRGGRYMAQIKEFLKYFPRESLKVILVGALVVLAAIVGYTIYRIRCFGARHAS